MRPAELTPVEIADQLHEAYLHDLGTRPHGPPPAQRTALADYLGCHEDAREHSWEAWTEQLTEDGLDLDEAQYWLDAEFIQPCPEELP